MGKSYHFESNKWFDNPSNRLVTNFPNRQCAKIHDIFKMNLITTSNSSSSKCFSFCKKNQNGEETNGWKVEKFKFEGCLQSPNHSKPTISKMKMQEAEPITVQINIMPKLTLYNLLVSWNSLELRECLLEFEHDFDWICFHTFSHHCENQPISESNHISLAFHPIDRIHQRNSHTCRKIPNYFHIEKWKTRTFGRWLTKIVRHLQHKNRFQKNIHPTLFDPMAS